MSERSVTRAAERLGRTQSAVSHSLARLRHGLGDPLLLKGNRRMEPTPFALALLEQAQPILRSLQRMLSPLRQFDPALSHRVFRLAAPDFVLTLFTELLSRLRADAPGVADRMDGAARDDAAGGCRGPARRRHRSGRLAPAGRHRCRADRRATLALLRPQGSPGLRALERSGLGAVAACRRPRRRPPREPGQCRGGRGPGSSRTIAGWVPNFSVIAPVLAGSDLLATLPVPAMADTLGPSASTRAACPSPSSRCRMSCCGRPRGPTIPKSPGCARACSHW